MQTATSLPHRSSAALARSHPHATGPHHLRRLLAGVIHTPRRRRAVVHRSGAHPGEPPKAGVAFDHEPFTALPGPPGATGAGHDTPAPRRRTDPLGHHPWARPPLAAADARRGGATSRSPPRGRPAGCRSAVGRTGCRPDRGCGPRPARARRCRSRGGRLPGARDVSGEGSRTGPHRAHHPRGPRREGAGVRARRGPRPCPARHRAAPGHDPPRPHRSRLVGPPAGPDPPRPAAPGAARHTAPRQRPAGRGTGDLRPAGVEPARRRVRQAARHLLRAASPAAQPAPDRPLWASDRDTRRLLRGGRGGGPGALPPAPQRL